MFQVMNQCTDLYFLPIDVHAANGEVHSDSVVLGVTEQPRLEAVDHAGLSHVAVADQDDLEQKVTAIFILLPCGLHFCNKYLRIVTH